MDLAFWNQLIQFGGGGCPSAITLVSYVSASHHVRFVCPAYDEEEREEGGGKKTEKREDTRQGMGGFT